MRVSTRVGRSRRYAPSPLIARAIPARRGRGQRATRAAREAAAERVCEVCGWLAGERTVVSDGLFKELSAPALPPSNGGGSDAPIANQLCAVASIPLPGLRRRSARARTRGQADRRATIFSLFFGEETTMVELVKRSTNATNEKRLP